jgi:hypothetical protein
VDRLVYARLGWVYGHSYHPTDRRGAVVPRHDPMKTFGCAGFPDTFQFYLDKFGRKVMPVYLRPGEPSDVQFFQPVPDKDMEFEEAGVAKTISVNELKGLQLREVHIFDNGEFCVWKPIHTKPGRDGKIFDSSIGISPK